MKSKLGMLAMLSIASTLSDNGYPGPRESYVELETEEDRIKRLAEARIKQYQAQGLKEFKYSKGSVWALNQKSADKKAKSKGFI